VLRQVRNQAVNLIDLFRRGAYSQSFFLLAEPYQLETLQTQSCLSRCLTLYMAAFDQVSKSYVARVSRERGALGAASGEGLGGVSL
jgi:hypothetical protein